MGPINDGTWIARLDIVNSLYNPTITIVFICWLFTVAINANAAVIQTCSQSHNLKRFPFHKVDLVDTSLEDLPRTKNLIQSILSAILDGNRSHFSGWRDMLGVRFDSANQFGVDQEGRIIFGTSDLQKTKDSSSLAFIVAHELAHVLLGHGHYLRFSNAYQLQEDQAFQNLFTHYLQFQNYNFEKKIGILKELREGIEGLDSTHILLGDFNREIFNLQLTRCYLNELRGVKKCNSSNRLDPSVWLDRDQLKAEFPEKSGLVNRLDENDRISEYYLHMVRSYAEQVLGETLFNLYGEIEADLVGTRLFLNAGFGPEAAILAAESFFSNPVDLEKCKRKIKLNEVVELTSIEMELGRTLDENNHPGNCWRFSNILQELKCYQSNPIESQFTPQLPIIESVKTELEELGRKLGTEH